jgi:hypothetical protein
MCFAVSRGKRLKLTDDKVQICESSVLRLLCRAAPSQIIEIQPVDIYRTSSTHDLVVEEGFMVNDKILETHHEDAQWCASDDFKFSYKFETHYQSILYSLTKFTNSIISIVLGYVPGPWKVFLIENNKVQRASWWSGNFLETHIQVALQSHFKNAFSCLEVNAMNGTFENINLTSLSFELVSANIEPSTHYGFLGGSNYFSTATNVDAQLDLGFYGRIWLLKFSLHFLGSRKCYTFHNWKQNRNTRDQNCMLILKNPDLIHDDTLAIAFAFKDKFVTMGMFMHKSYAGSAWYPFY